MRWTFDLLTPPHPSDPAVLEKGLPQGQDYASLVKTRHIPAIGDNIPPGGVEIKYDVALLAKAFRPVAPELAGQLMWSFNQGGAPAVLKRKAAPVSGAQVVPPRFLIASLTPEDFAFQKAPPLDSRRLPGFGAVMRAGVETHEESYVLFRCGPAGVRFSLPGPVWQSIVDSLFDKMQLHYYYHVTDNEIVYYAKGVPLLAGGIDERQVSPISKTDGSSFWGGRIALFRSFPDVDYAVGASPRFDPDLRRHVLFAKNDYLVISDELVRAQPVHWKLVVLAGRAEAEGEKAHFVGALGTDLEVFLPGSKAWGQPLSFIPLKPAFGSASIPLQALCVRVPEGTNLRAILLPRSPQEAPAQAKALADSLWVQNADMNDVIFVGKPTSFKGDGVCFEGRCALVQRRKDGLKLHLLDGQRLEADGVSVSSTGASVSLMFAGGALRGQTEGPAATLFIGAPQLSDQSRLVVDGRKQTPRLLDGRLLMLLKDGRHQFEVRITENR